MLERMTGMVGIKGGLFVALALALAVPNVGCGKKKEESTSDDEKSSKKKKDDDSEKDSKKKKGDDDDDKPSKKKKDDDDDKPAKKKGGDDDDDSKSAKKVKAPKSVDDDDDDDDDDDKPAAPKKPKAKLAPLHGETDITGTWGLAGKNQDGKKYKGTATITKIAGQMFKATWKIGGDTQQGLIFKDGNVLSCGWSAKHDLGVIAYLVKPGSLDGVWFEEQHTSIGKEFLTGPASKAALSGTYNIKNGETPEKKKYSGKVEVMILKSGVYRVTWKFGSSTLKGLGLRSDHFEGGDTDVLSAGFNDGGDAGVLQYIIYSDAKTMHGHWAAPSKSGGDPGWGKEVMVKAE